MSQATRRKSLLPLLAVPVLLIIIAVVVLSLTRGGSEDAALAQMDSAVTFLRQLESGDPDQVVQTIRQQQNARVAAEREQLRDRLVNGEIDVWSQFQDYVILGDSRASGFYYYNWLPGEYVLAEPGDTIWKIEEHLDEIAALNPGKAFLAYGGNDMAYWSSGEDFAAEYARLIAELQEAVPGIEIYVCSILLVQDWVTSAGLGNIPEYNTALRDMCQREGYSYVDCDAIIAEHQDLYEGDGIHFKSAFYPHWGANLILATYYRGTEGG